MSMRSAPLLSAPTSFAQRQIWLLAQADADAAAYNVMRSLRLRGRLDVAALELALTEVVRRHESLRTTFPAEADGGLQTVWPPEPFQLPVTDLSGCRHPALEAAERARQAARRPFDVSNGPLARAELWRVDEAEHVLTLSLHHLVTDAWSDSVLYRDLTALYGAFAAGRPSPLPDPPVQYADFAVWERDRVRGDHLERLLRYWRRRLHGASPVLGRGTRRLAAGDRRGRFEDRRWSLPPPAMDRARHLASELRITPFVVLLTAFAIVLQRWTGRDDLLVGSLVANRGRPELEGLVGCFVNTLLLRADLTGNPTMRELLRRVGNSVLDDQVHQELPFDRLVEELGPGPTRGGARFQAMFQVQDLLLPPVEAAGVGFEGLPGDAEPARVALNLTIGRYEPRWFAAWDYDADRFDDQSITELHRLYVRVLAELLDDAGRRLDELSRLSPSGTPLAENVEPAGPPEPAPSSPVDAGPVDASPVDASPLEALLIDIWTEVLQVEEVGPGADFFDLGGHSLLATRVVSRLRREIGLDVSVRMLFERPVLADLAAGVLQQAVDQDPSLLDERDADDDR